MGKKLVYINGTPSESIRDIAPDLLLRGNYVYAAVACDGHAPLYLERQMEFARATYEKLHGAAPLADTRAIRHDIKELLVTTLQPQTGNVVMIYLIPHGYGDAQPDVVISHSHSTIYHGYALVSLRPAAAVVNYEIPFSGYRTAVSLAAAGYMDDFARRAGANIALRANRGGHIVSSGDYPVFTVKDGTVITPPLAQDTGDSVERQLMFRACSLARTPLEEREISLTELPEMEEIMVFDHTGIRSVLSCSGNYYYNLIADRLEEVLPRINKEGLE